MKIAILSPSKNTYSETFIQAQKQNLAGEVFYYFDGEIPSKLEGKGSVLIKNAGLKRKLGLIGDDIRLTSLRHSIIKNKIDVVLAQYGPTGNAVCQLCKQLNIPLVVHFHGYDASILNVIKRNNNYKQVFEIAKKVIAVSKVMVNDLINLGCQKEKIVYNPCAPSNSFFKINRVGVTTKQFAAVGRFTDKKAPYFTILAFKKVLDKHPDAKLVFGGDGNLLNTCKNLAHYLSIEKSVEFKGVISPEEIKFLLSDSIAFVQHSITAENGDKEGTPVSILEASAAGLPVISTLHAGVPDVIIHNKTGLLSEEKDVDAMAENMTYILENQSLAKEMGDEGRKNIMQNFNLKKHIETLDTLFLNLMKA